jgi:hypothetical protein
MKVLEIKAIQIATIKTRTMVKSKATSHGTFVVKPLRRCQLSIHETHVYTLLNKHLQYIINKNKNKIAPPNNLTSLYFHGDVSKEDIVNGRSNLERMPI